MEKKKILVSLLAAILLFSFTATPAFAGNSRRQRPGHRIERNRNTRHVVRQASPRHFRRHRVAPKRHFRARRRVPELGLFIGGAILGGIILHGLSESHRTTYQNEDGYWETSKYWVEPVYKRVWKYGFTTRRGRWIPGHWKQILVKPGYWREVREWVASNR